eukprot:scaffold78269_cov18-Tisochrysis_lutea.AAC.3
MGRLLHKHQGMYLLGAECVYDCSNCVASARELADRVERGTLLCNMTAANVLQGKWLTGMGAA